jgi:release factor glutamine methyltransferase
VSKDNLNSIFSVLKNARNALQDSSDSPALDAELLLAHCLGKNQTYLHTWPEKLLNTQQSACFSRFIEKRKTDYPVAYMLGHKEFWTLDLIVTEDVLIPRPETELLVEIALEKIKHINKPNILDLGTGSGAIALALASERRDALITACDYSNDALKIATKNAINNQLDGAVTFIKSNWFSNIKEQFFDLIVSNPPYIDPDDPHLQQSIKHEPIQALMAKRKGFADIETIIKKSPAYLNKQGFLIVEHGFEQSELTLKLFNQYGFSHAKNCIDLNHNPRVSFAQWV